MKKIRQLMIAPSLLLASLVLAQTVLAQTEGEPIQTDWLEPVKGYQGKALGTELVNIEQSGAADDQIITLTVPKTAIALPGNIEEVRVVGKRPKSSEPLNISYEWLGDYDNNNYGLVIRLSKETKWPIRFYLDAGDEGRGR